MSKFNNAIQASLTDAVALIKLAHKNRQSVIILGAAGVGKTKVMERLDAELAGRPIDSEIPYYFALGCETLESLQGLYVPTGDKVENLTMALANPHRFPLAKYGIEGEGVIIMDEMMHSKPSTYPLLYKLLQENKVGDDKIASGYSVVAIANRAGDGYEVMDIPEPVLNRCMVIEIQHTGKEAFDEWANDFAYGANISPVLLSYYSQNSQNLNNVDTERNSKSFSSQRSVTNVSPYFYAYERGEISRNRLQIAVEGWVGDLANDIMLHMEFGYKLPSTEEILRGANPVMSADNQTSASQYYIICRCRSALYQMMVDKKVSDADLAKAWQNLHTYVVNNFKSNGGAHLDMVVGLGRMVLRYMTTLIDKARNDKDQAKWLSDRKMEITGTKAMMDCCRDYRELTTSLGNYN